MSNELIVIFVLGATSVLLLCATVGFLGWNLARVLTEVLKFNHKEDRDNRALLERFLELHRTPTHQTLDVVGFHAQERNAQVVAETKTEIVNRDPVPEHKVATPMMFSTDPDVRGHYS